MSLGWRADRNAGSEQQP